MSVIIRLQNLPWSANASDIRQYFHGLSIPEGGVHIIGGEMADAFIAFSTDEDARQAMMLGGGKIKEVQITLMLSSRSEMQKVIEAARQPSLSSSMVQLLAPPSVPALPLSQHNPIQQTQLLQQQLPNSMKDRRASREDKKDSSDVRSGSHETNRRDKKDKSRSRSRDRSRKDRRDRDRRRRSRSRSRSRSRDRDRRRRRSRSRSRGRSKRKDSRDEPKKDKDKEVTPPKPTPDVAPASLPNLGILNPDQWTNALAQSAPILSRLTDLGLLSNFASQKAPILPTPTAVLPPALPASSNVAQLLNLQSLKVRFPVSVESDEDSNSRKSDLQRFRGNSRDNDFNGRNPTNSKERDSRNRPNRGPDSVNRGNSYSRDSDVDQRGGNEGNFRGFNDNGAGNFRENLRFGDANRENFDRNRINSAFDMPRPDQNFSKPGFGQRNEQMSRFGPPLGNRDRPGPGHLSNPNNMPQRDGSMNMPQRERPFTSRFSDRSSQDDGVDEFGRSIQMRNRKSNDGFNDQDEFQGPRSQPNFPGFQTRFVTNPPSGPPGPMGPMGPIAPLGGPPSLMRGRESWPPGRGNPNNDNFQDRRNFRGFDDQNRFRQDFTGNSRFQNRNRNYNRQNFNDNDDDTRNERDCCVELRSLAPRTAYGDVRRLFSNMKIIVKDIKFFDYTEDSKKCRVLLLSNENKRRVMQNSKDFVVDGKPLQLIDVPDSDFENCVDEGVRRPEPKFSDDEDDSVNTDDLYVQVKDLSLHHVESDVEELFGSSGIDDIKLVVAPDGDSKIAYVKFTKAVDAKHALNISNPSVSDVRVVISSSTQKQFNGVRKKTKNDDAETKIKREGETEPEKGEKMRVKNEDPRKQDSSQKSKSDCILIKNLPLEASDRDICDFFSDVGLVPTRIHLMLDMRGERSGDAFCEFNHAEQAVTACSKNNMPLGKNNLVVHQVDRSEMSAALGLLTEGPPFSRPGCVVSLENISYRANNFDIINFFGWNYNLTDQNIMRRFNERGLPTGDARVAFHSPDEAMRAIHFLNNKIMMGRTIRMHLL